MAYRYWVLRYVPDAVRGEFVNIGVVVGGEGSDWAIRRLESLSRANRLGGRPEVAAEWLDSLENAISADRHDFNTLLRSGEGEAPQPNSGMMESLRIKHTNAVQISESRPVRAKNAQVAADILYGVLVYEAPGKRQSNSRNESIRYLRNFYQHAPKIPTKAIQSKVEISWGRQLAKFEFSIGINSVVQLSQVWSFDRVHLKDLDDQIRSWSLGVRMLRDKGGEVINPQRSRPVPIPAARDAAVRVLYVPPKTSEQEESYAAAAELWEELDIRAYPRGEELALVREAEHALAAVG